MTRTGVAHGDVALPTAAAFPETDLMDTLEFVHVNSTEMCAAEDVFLHGKHLLSKPRPASLAPNPIPRQLPARSPRHGREPKRCPSDHDKSYGRGGGGGGAATRYHRLRSAKAAGCESVSAESPAQLKWYVLVFGSVNVPAEMDMRDIKSRQRRRAAAAQCCPEGNGKEEGAGDGGGVSPEKKGRGGWGWKLIRSLSCRGDLDGTSL